MKKAVMMFVLLILLSSFGIAQEIAEDSYEDEETCMGFWGKLNCVLFGDPGRRALVGEAGELSPASTKEEPKIYEGLDSKDSYKYRVVNGEWQSLSNKKGAKWVIIQTSSLTLNQKNEAINKLNKKYPDALKQPQPKPQTPAAPSPPPPAPPTPEDLNAKADGLLKGIQAAASPPAAAPAGTTPPAAGAKPALLDQNKKTALKNALGEDIYTKYLGENGESINQYNLVRDGVLRQNDGTTITYIPPDKDGFKTVKVTGKDKDGKETILINTLSLGGQKIATQKKSGEIEVLSQTVTFPKGKTIDSLKDGALFFGKTADKLGGSVTIDVETGQVVVYNYDDETRSLQDTKTGETEQTSGDYYPKGESGCKDAGGCYFADGGTLQVPIDIDGNGNIDPEKEMVPYTVDYDWKGFGGDKKPQRIELFDHRGNRVGTQEGNTRILAKKTDAGYIYEIKEGDTVVKAKRTDVGVVPVVEEGEEPELITKKAQLVEKHQQAVEGIYSGTEGGLAKTQAVFESIYAITSSVKDFPALSKLFFGESDFYKKHTAWADKNFAPALGTNWFPSFCETDARWAKIEPEGKAVIKTVSGTYQAVASIQMERSERKTPVLCHKNPDEEADEQFICDRSQVCVDESFCWKDQNGDKKPDRDEEEPLQGYFYKITWAVSSPQDEKLTPFVDENGVAVSFNIFLNPTASPFGAKTPQSIPLYSREGNTISPMELRNGQSDKNHIIKYSPKEYQEACIVWDKAPSTFKGKAGFSEADPIPNVCFQAQTSEVGRVNWERSGQGGTSVSGNKGDISRNTNW